MIVFGAVVVALMLGQSKLRGEDGVTTRTSKVGFRADSIHAMTELKERVSVMRAEMSGQSPISSGGFGAQGAGIQSRWDAGDSDTGYVVCRGRRNQIG